MEEAKFSIEDPDFLADVADEFPKNCLRRIKPSGRRLIKNNKIPLHRFESDQPRSQAQINKLKIENQLEQQKLWKHNAKTLNKISFYLDKFELEKMGFYEDLRRADASER